MKKEIKEKISYGGDIAAIVTSFVMAGLTLYTSFGAIFFIPLIVFYVYIGVTRLVILIFEIKIAKMGLDTRNRFIKERRILRLTGLSLFFFNIMFFSVLLVLVLRTPSELYSKYQFAIIGYALFCVYKIVSSIIFLVRARTSYSPYRETICCLSFIAALMGILSLEVTLLALYADGGRLVWLIFKITTAGVIAFIVFVLSIVMMIARRVPRELRKR